MDYRVILSPKAVRDLEAIVLLLEPLPDELLYA